MAISVTDKCKLRNNSPNTIWFCLENDSSIHRISYVVLLPFIVSSFFATCILLVQNTIENYNLEGESRNFQSHSDGNGMNVVLSSHLVTMLLLQDQYYCGGGTFFGLLTFIRMAANGVVFKKYFEEVDQHYLQYNVNSVILKYILLLQMEDVVCDKEFTFASFSKNSFEYSRTEISAACTSVFDRHGTNSLKLFKVMTSLSPSSSIVENFEATKREKCLHQL